MYYFDTSVLVPVFISLHPNHEVFVKLLESLKREGKLFTSTHTMAELYSTISKLPHDLTLNPVDVAKVINEELKNIFEIIELDRKDYKKAIKRCADLQLKSGIIYDALHLQAAIKAKIDVLYTANLRDFNRLYTSELKFELKGLA